MVQRIASARTPEALRVLAERLVRTTNVEEQKDLAAGISVVVWGTRAVKSQAPNPKSQPRLNNRQIPSENLPIPNFQWNLAHWDLRSLGVVGGCELGIDLFLSQSDHRIDARGAQRRNVARDTRLSRGPAARPRTSSGRSC